METGQWNGIVKVEIEKKFSINFTFCLFFFIDPLERSPIDAFLSRLKTESVNVNGRALCGHICRKIKIDREHYKRYLRYRSRFVNNSLTFIFYV